MQIPKNSKALRFATIFETSRATGMPLPIVVGYTAFASIQRFGALWIRETGRSEFAKFNELVFKTDFCQPAWASVPQTMAKIVMNFDDYLESVHKLDGDLLRCKALTNSFKSTKMRFPLG